jgi:hypothetical protein
MRFTDSQIHRLAEALVSALGNRGGARLKAPRERILARIEAIIRANLSAEDDLDSEARRLLDEHMRNAPPGMDQQKLLQMIKRRLAEERDIPL